MPVTVRPSSPPTILERTEAVLAQQELASEPERMKQAAENWRTGLAGVLALTLATTAFATRKDLAVLDVQWRWTVLGLALASVLAGVIGLDRLLRAAYGSPRWEQRSSSNPADLADRDGRRRAATQLRSGRRYAYAALALFLVALVVERTAPVEPVPKLSVVDAAGHRFCGKVVATGDGKVTLELDKASFSLAIAELRAVRSVAECP